MSQSKKDIIRNAAIEVISREGFHRATSDKIAAQAGISVGTIYYYFENKEEILAYIFQGEYERRAGEINRLSELNIHPLDKIKQILEFHFKIVCEDDKVARIIIREKHLPFSVPGGVKRIGGILKFIETTLEEGKASGQLRNCDVGVVSAVIFGMVDGVVNRYILEKDEKGESNLLDRALKEIDDLLWNGLSR